MRPPLRYATAGLLPLAMTACHAPSTAPAGDAVLIDLAPAFGEERHGFTVLAPALRGDGDALEGGRYDELGRLALAPGGRYASQLLRWGAPFDELLLSWNALVPAGGGLALDVQLESVARAERSPWLALGRVGDRPPAPADACSSFEGGRVEVDIVRCERTFDAFRYRLRAASEGTEEVLLCASAACLSERARLADLDPGPLPDAARTLAVPARSQQDAPAALAPRVCSPTSVAMVLAHHGVDVPLDELCAAVYDREHDLYGNWPRAVQAAFERGVPGTLVRLSSWRAVAHFVAAGVPLVASVRAEPGELAGAPYERTAGHLLVIRGFDGAGGVLVNDPAAPLASVARTYSAQDLARCWLARGGVAYALSPAPVR